VSLQINMIRFTSCSYLLITFEEAQKYIFISFQWERKLLGGQSKKCCTEIYLSIVLKGERRAFFLLNYFPFFKMLLMFSFILYSKIHFFPYLYYTEI